MQPKIRSCSRLMTTGLNNVVLPTLFNVNNSILFSIVTPNCRLIQAQQHCSLLLTTCIFYSAESLLGNNEAIEENEESEEDLGPDRFISCYCMSSSFAFA